MKRPARKIVPNPNRRRGAAYIIVLAAAMIVTVIGLSALAVNRIQTRVAETNRDAVKARFYAQSVAEVVLLRLAADPSWRSTYTDDTWTAEETFGELTCRFKLVDEDGDLADDMTDPVRLHAKAMVGDAVRLSSVLLKASGGSGNLLTNPGFESGDTGWNSWNCTLVASSAAHGGSLCAKLNNRGSMDATAWKDVTEEIENGTTYYVEVWAKTVSGTEMVTISFKTTASTSGTRIFVTPSTAVGTMWTKVSGVLAPTWTGTLAEARWRVFSYPDGGSSDFFIDDAMMVEGNSPPVSKMVVVPGSWRREVEP